jgi:transcriptional regulator with XRE-family HTH domain
MNALDNVAPMRSVEEGTVYLSLERIGDDDVCDDVWGGSCQFHDDSPIVDGPTFADASDAVEWWRSRGAKTILIRLNFNEHFWAGEGTPPEDCAEMPIFDANDPRGRPEGARRTIEEHDRAEAVRANTEQVEAAIEEGRQLTVRREAEGLSVDELADRLGTTPQWLLDVESGKSSFQVTLTQWINIVWATRPGWPNEKSNAEPRRIGWVARHGQFLSQAERIVNESINLED